MIPILYKSDEVDFYDNGIGALNDIYDVDVQEQRNGLFTLTASYPVSGQRYKDIEVGRIVLAKPNQNDSPQAFRIVHTELDISGYALTIEADHITYDLTHNLVKSVHLQGNGQNAMTHLQEATVAPHLFRFISDLQHEGDSTLTMVNPMEAIAGTQGSILQIWGGELKRDNRTVSMLSRRGRNNFTSFRLGKNINGLKYTVDTANLVTRIVPSIQRPNGNENELIIGDIVDSKNVGNYPNYYMQHVDVADNIKIDENDSDDVIKGKINAYAKNWFTQSANSKIDLPEVTVEIDVTSLQDSADYQDKFKNLEAIELTDSVTVYVPEFGVNVQAIVNELHYDPVAERVTSIVIGTSKLSFADANSNTLKELGSSINKIRENAVTAIVSANGKNTNYYGTEEPAHPVEGDLWFKSVGDETYLMIFKDGRWQEWVSTKTQNVINKAVDDSLASAKEYTDELNDRQASEAAVFQSEANAALSSAAAERAAFSSNATSMANSAASRASSLANSAAAYGKAQATSALSSANSALTTAKSDLTDDISVAKSEAIEAAKTADGVVKKQITDTADSINLTISQNKSDADGKIKTAQTAATQALDGLKAKVDQTTYDTKTGQLDKAVGSAALTADSAALSIKNYQSTADGKLSSQAAAITANSKAIDTKVSQTNFDTVTGDLTTKYGNVKTTADAVTAEVTKYETANDKKVSANTASINALNNQITSKVSQTDFDKTTGDLSGKYSVQQQTINGISQTVTELQAKANAQGQVNQLMNTEFNPDLQSWSSVDVKDINNTSVDKYVYRSLIWGGSRSIGINTTSETGNYYALFGQKISIRSGETMSFSWYSKTWRNDNYANLHFVTLDSDNNLINDQYVAWDSTVGGGWERHVKENIKLEDNATYLIVSFQARQGFVGNLVKPMLVYGTFVGDYVPGNYNNNNRVAALELDVDGITGLVKDPNKGLSATWNLASNGQTIAVQAQKDATSAITTAKGIQTQVTSNDGDIKNLQSITTQTAGQITTEIQDRKSGDSSVRTDLSSLIDQRVKETKSGYESYFSQQAQGIIAGLSMPNKLYNTEFTPDLEGWETGADAGSQKPYRSFTYEGSNVVGFYTNMTNDKKYAWLRQVVMLPKTISDSQRLSICWDVMTKLNSNYTSLWFKWRDGTGNPLNQDTLFYWNADKADGNWQHKKIENISIPDGAVSVQVAFESREQTIQYLAKPMLVFDSKIGTYMPGSYSGMNTSTVLELFKDNWGIGIQDNVGLITSGIIGDKKNIALISDNVVIKSPSTQITGTTWITSAMIKDGAIGNAQIGNAAISSAQIINVDVSKISGNIANFITANVDTLNARVLYGDTGHLGTTDTGRIINKQDNHLQLAAKGFYDSTNDRAQLELLGNSDNSISDDMKGSLNYYGNPTDKGHGLGIRMKYNQILAIDEDGGSKNLYLSPYAGGQVRIVSRDLNSYYDIAAANFRVSSQRKFKSDIKPLDDGALDIVNKTNIKSYTKNGVSEIGVIADEAPSEVLSDDGKFINIYDYTSILYKAVQELSQQVEELKDERTSNQQFSSGDC